MTPAPPITDPEPIAPTPALSIPDMLYVIGIVWAAVAALYLTFRLTVHGIYVASLSKSKTLPSPALSACYSDVCGKMGIKKAPRLYVSASVVSPMLVGFFSPCVILPDVKFNDIELEGILSHELTHYRRGDLWLKLFSLIATSLHWFNPLVHIAAARLAQETELSCDEAVLSGSNDEVRRIYGEAVLSVIRRNCHKSIALTTHFNPKKSAVKERFKAILDSTKKRRGRVIIAVALVLCIVAGAVISCSFGNKKQPTDEDFGTITEKTEFDFLRYSLTAPDALIRAAPIGTLYEYMDLHPDEAEVPTLFVYNKATFETTALHWDFDKECTADVLFIEAGKENAEVFVTLKRKDADTEKEVYLSYRFICSNSLTEPESVSVLDEKEIAGMLQRKSEYEASRDTDRLQSVKLLPALSRNFERIQGLPDGIDKAVFSLSNDSSKLAFYVFEPGEVFYLYNGYTSSFFKHTLSLPDGYTNGNIIYGYHPTFNYHGPCLIVSAQKDGKEVYLAYLYDEMYLASERGNVDYDQVFELDEHQIAGLKIALKKAAEDPSKYALPENFYDIYHDAEQIYGLFTGYGSGSLIEYTGERITYNGHDYDSVVVNGAATLDELKTMCAKHLSYDLVHKLLKKEARTQSPIYIEQEGKLYRFGGYVAQYGNAKEDSITLENIENGVYTIRVDTHYDSTPVSAYCSFIYQDDEIRFNSFELTYEVYIGLNRLSGITSTDVIPNLESTYVSLDKKMILLPDWLNDNGSSISSPSVSR